MYTGKHTPISVTLNYPVPVDVSEPFLKSTLPCSLPHSYLSHSFGVMLYEVFSRTMMVMSAAAADPGGACLFSVIPIYNTRCCIHCQFYQLQATLGPMHRGL